MSHKINNINMVTRWYANFIVHNIMYDIESPPSLQGNRYIMIIYIAICINGSCYVAYTYSFGGLGNAAGIIYG